MWLNFRHLRKVELSQKVNCSYLNTCIFNHLFQLELGTGDSTVNVLHLSPCVSTFFAAGPLHRVFVLSSRHADSDKWNSDHSIRIESRFHGSAACKTVIFCRRYYNKLFIGRTSIILHWNRPIENHFSHKHEAILRRG